MWWRRAGADRPVASTLPVSGCRLLDIRDSPCRRRLPSGHVVLRQCERRLVNKQKRKQNPVVFTHSLFKTVVYFVVHRVIEIDKKYSRSIRGARKIYYIPPHASVIARLQFCSCSRSNLLSIKSNSSFLAKPNVIHAVNYSHSVQYSIYRDGLTVIHSVD